MTPHPKALKCCEKCKETDLVIAGATYSGCKNVVCPCHQPQPQEWEARKEAGEVPFTSQPEGWRSKEPWVSIFGILYDVQGGPQIMDVDVALKEIYDLTIPLLLKQKQEIRESTIKECIKVAMNSRAIFFGTKDSLEPPADEQLSELKAEIVTNMQRLLLSDTEEK